MKPIDWSKPVQTRDGRKVRVLCTDLDDSTHPVAAHVLGSTDIHRYTLEGLLSNLPTHPLCLINAPERVERWRNVYPLGDGTPAVTYSRREDARIAGGGVQLLIERITYEDGKPVSVALEDAQ